MLRTTYFIDTTTGPAIKTRYVFNCNFLKKVGLIILVLTMLLLTFTVAFAGMEEPTIKVSCTNAGILVFQDMDDNYIANVCLASAEQLEAIKDIRGILVDETVNDFALCTTEVHYFNIWVDGEELFCHGNDITPPPEYNHVIPEVEFEEMLQNSSEETRFLYNELSMIFKTA